MKELRSLYPNYGPVVLLCTFKHIVIPERYIYVLGSYYLEREFRGLHRITCQISTTDKSKISSNIYSNVTVMKKHLSAISPSDDPDRRLFPSEINVFSSLFLESV